VGALVKLGWLDGSHKPWLAEGMTLGEVTRDAIGAWGATEAYVMCIAV